MVVSFPSMEASNEDARDLAEKEVFGVVHADETLVVEDETDVLVSKELKGLADSNSKLVCLGNCGAPLTLNFVGEFLCASSLG